MNSLINLIRPRSAKEAAVALLSPERPPIQSERISVVEAQPRSSELDEYRQLSASLGIAHPHIDADLTVEKFKSYLRQKDWPIFALPTVVEYMDKKSAEESAAKAGWHWHPLREKDNIVNARFGKSAIAWGSGQEQREPASDHYHGPHNERRSAWSNGHQEVIEQTAKIAASALPYDKLVPLCALRKVAAVEKEFSGPVSFFVCDYAPAPHIEYPDPFLMAVIDNPRLAGGVGRFVIDFWDEPGFGISQMLK